MSEYSKSDILQFAAENSKIDIDTILREMELRDRRKLLDKHPYDIWQGEKDKRWFTYLPDEKKGRVLKSRKTREALEDLDVAKAQARDDEFLFSENHKRLTSRQLNYHLEKVCRELGIAVRSSHKIRRSYASKLLSENVDSAFIQKQMGHKQIATTQAYYHYDLASDKSKLDEIDRVIDF